MSTNYARLNTALLVLVLLTGLAILATLALRAEGGPLDPPGPPASTDSVRLPGTPISSLPFAINQSGYYYVTRDLTGAPGQNGISINTGNVTVDLGGFRLLGGATPGDGIIVTGGFRNITIRNGSVRSWTDGVDLSSASMSRVDGVHSSSNWDAGFRIGLRSALQDCNASLNTVGVDVNYGSVRNCVVSENTSRGISLGAYALAERNFVTGNSGEVGVYVGTFSVVRENVVLGNSGSSYDINSVGESNMVIENVYCALFVTGTTTVFVDNRPVEAICP